MAPSATLLVDCRCTLGEGILWWPDRRSLLWTDIEKSTLWIHRVDDDVSRQVALPDRLGSFAICESGRLLLGLAKSLVYLDPETGHGADSRVEPIMAIEPTIPRNRINDGRTDRAGNFAEVSRTARVIKDHCLIQFFEIRVHAKKRRAAVMISIIRSTSSGVL